MDSADSININGVMKWSIAAHQSARDTGEWHIKPILKTTPAWLVPLWAVHSQFPYGHSSDRTPAET